MSQTRLPSALRSGLLLAREYQIPRALSSALSRIIISAVSSVGNTTSVPLAFKVGTVFPSGVRLPPLHLDAYEDQLYKILMQPMMYAIVAVLGFSVLSCSSSSPSSVVSTTPTSVSTIPAALLGTAQTGVTLAGPLAGKTLYLLPSPMNQPNCWMDSQEWTGSELFFAITSLDYTALSQGTLTYNGSCSPSPGFAVQSSPGTTGNFNLYRAEISGGSWAVTSLPLNIGQTTSLGAAKLASASSLLAYVKFEKPGSLGNIYFTTRTGDNTYSAPTAYSNNSSSCDDDNPYLNANGTQLIFTSSRTTGLGTSCISGKKLLWNSTLSGNAWSTPVQIAVSASSGTINADQAWLDSTGTNLYWTDGGSNCSPSAPPGTCVMTATGSGTTFTTSPTAVALPPGVAAWPTTGSFVVYVGQFSMSGQTAFMVCGVATFIGTSSVAGLTTLNSQTVTQGANTASAPYNYYHIQFQTCVAQ